VPLGALVVFVALAVLLFASTWAHPGTAWIGDDRDPHLFVWYLGWTPRQLGSGQNPLFTNYLDYPGGANLMWNTAIFAPATLLWPVTAAFGPVVSYNVMATAAVALSAWCGFLAVRRLVPNDLFAAVAGLLYGFSPYMVAQSTRHPHVTLAMFPPLVLLLLHEVLVRQRRSAVAMGCLLAAASAAQLLTGEEILATTALVAVGGIGLLVVLHPRQIAHRAPHALVALGSAVVCFGILAAYPLLFQFTGPRQARGLLQPPNTYVSDLAAFVVPPRAMWFSTKASIAVTGAFTGNPSENDAYLGVPLILVLAAAAVLRWRQPVVRWAALLAVGLAVLSLGPQLHVGGHVTALPLPWALVQRLPLMQNVLPARLMLFAFLGMGLVLAEGADAAVRAGPPQAALAVGAIVLALVPLLPRLPYPSTPAQAPRFFSAGGGAARMPHGSVVLVTPYSNNLTSVAMYWQAAAGYTFRMPEGEAFVPGPTLAPTRSYLQTTLTKLNQGQTVPTSPGDRARALHDLSAFGVSTIVAGPSPGHDRIVGYLTTILGRPPVRTGGVDVWWNVGRAG
jgi:hypothetical protein